MALPIDDTNFSSDFDVFHTEELDARGRLVPPHTAKTLVIMFETKNGRQYGVDVHINKKDEVVQVKAFNQN